MAVVMPGPVTEEGFQLLFEGKTTRRVTGDFARAAAMVMMVMGFMVMAVLMAMDVHVLVAVMSVSVVVAMIMVVGVLVVVAMGVLMAAFFMVVMVFMVMMRHGCSPCIRFNERKLL